MENVYAVMVTMARTAIVNWCAPTTHVAPMVRAFQGNQGGPEVTTTSTACAMVVSTCLVNNAKKGVLGVLGVCAQTVKLEISA